MAPSIDITNHESPCRWSNVLFLVAVALSLTRFYVLIHANRLLLCVLALVTSAFHFEFVIFPFPLSEQNVDHNFSPAKKIRSYYSINFTT